MFCRPFAPIPSHLTGRKATKRVAASRKVSDGNGRWQGGWSREEASPFFQGAERPSPCRLHGLIGG